MTRSVILLLRNNYYDNQSANVNCPRSGDKEQCEIHTWDVGTPRGGAGA